MIVLQVACISTTVDVHVGNQMRGKLAFLIWMRSRTSLSGFGTTVNENLRFRYNHVFYSSLF